MINQTLHQIGQMSQKIHQSVKKALQQNYKPSLVSPETHHQSHPHSSHPTKKTPKKHEKSSSQPHPYPPPSPSPNQSHLHIQLLQQQNSLLKNQLSQHKERARVYRQEVRDLKKYIKFLQGYNDQLKKEVVLWMTRPAKKSREVYGDLEADIESKAREYRGKFNSILVSKTLRQGYESTNNNSVNLTNLVNSTNIPRNNAHRHPHNPQHSSSESQQQSSQQPQIQITTAPNHNAGNPKNRQDINVNRYQMGQSYHFSLASNNKTKAKAKGQRGGKLGMASSFVANPEDGQCTSCNYLRYRMQRDSFLGGLHYNGHSHVHQTINNNQKKGKNSLCPCHQKYIKTGHF